MEGLDKSTNVTPDLQACDIENLQSKATQKWQFGAKSTPPLPSNRHHRSSGDCLEGKGKN